MEAVVLLARERDPLAVLLEPVVLAPNDAFPLAVLLLILPAPRPTVIPLMTASELAESEPEIVSVAVGLLVPIPSRLLSQ